MTSTIITPLASASHHTTPTTSLPTSLTVSNTSVYSPGFHSYLNQHYIISTNQYPQAPIDALSDILWQEWLNLTEEEKYEYAQMEQYTEKILKRIEEKGTNHTRSPSQVLSQVHANENETNERSNGNQFSNEISFALSNAVSPSQSSKYDSGFVPTLSRTSSPAYSPRMIDFYEPLKLEHLRSNLVRLEESIIFGFIERAQFKLNSAIYDPNAMPQFGGNSCLMHFLKETEKLHSIVRRYTSPDEHPFYNRSDLPDPILPPLQYPLTIKPNNININDRILDFYLTTILPSVCMDGDDQNYGSCALFDISCLQILSKRIHYGKFVAESKFRSEPELFTHAIRKKDIAKLTELITKPVVEEQILQRVHLKAATYGSEPSQLIPSASSPTHASLNGTKAPCSSKASYKISPDVIASIYQQIMTLTKDVQIEYLLQRLDC